MLICPLLVVVGVWSHRRLSRRLKPPSCRPPPTICCTSQNTFKRTRRQLPTRAKVVNMFTMVSNATPRRDRPVKVMSRKKISCRLRQRRFPPSRCTLAFFKLPFYMVTCVATCFLLLGICFFCRNGVVTNTNMLKWRRRMAKEPKSVTFTWSRRGECH